jgi:STAS-like domain of unknown function (DUF4325)
MKSSVFINVTGGSTGFAEDKDEARRIRVGKLLPALSKDSLVILDFRDIKYSTQSFVHALLGEVLQRYGEDVLAQIDFKNCTPQLKSLIQLVVDYSLGGFKTSGSTSGNLIPQSEGPHERPPSAKKTPTRKISK